MNDQQKEWESKERAWEKEKEQLTKEVSEKNVKKSAEVGHMFDTFCEVYQEVEMKISTKG